ncbi:MAG: hypothetical protein AABX74_02615 [Nanoarchaeota archaeon]
MTEKTEEQTKDKILHIFRLQYTWYEGEHDSTILATTKEKEEIEKDLKDAASLIETDVKREKEAVYKPDAYQRIIEILKQKGYIVCYFLIDQEYYVEEIGTVENTKFLKYGIIHKIKKTEDKMLE